MPRRGRCQKEEGKTIHRLHPHPDHPRPSRDVLCLATGFWKCANSAKAGQQGAGARPPRGK